MAYNILAFDPEATTDEQFEQWWAGQAQWDEDHSYEDPSVCTPALRGFYRDLVTTFPAMNGPDAPSDEQLDEHPELEDRLTDYSVGKYIVYASAAWSQAEAMCERCVELARKHGVALAFVSEAPLRIQR